VHGEALAYNCIGVDFMKLGASEPSLYQDAIEKIRNTKKLQTLRANSWPTLT
jgi:hypothetical protein